MFNNNITVSSSDLFNYLFTAIFSLTYNDSEDLFVKSLNNHFSSLNDKLRDSFTDKKYEILTISLFLPNFNFTNISEFFYYLSDHYNFHLPSKFFIFLNSLNSSFKNDFLNLNSNVLNYFHLLDLNNFPLHFIESSFIFLLVVDYIDKVYPSPWNTQLYFIKKQILESIHHNFPYF